MQTKINERPVIGEELNSILHPSIIIDRTECNDLKATADEYKKILNNPLIALKY